MNDNYPFENLPLPYEYDALEPYIGAETLRLHHDAHLKGYIDKLNAVLEQNPRLQKLTLAELLRLPPRSVSPETALAIRRNAGGVFNHRLYFDSMAPGSVAPRGELAARLRRRFGSIDGFTKQLAEAAASVFGSGYAWLCEDMRGGLLIATTANQDTPTAKPLLCIDVWEHAYYLDYRNLRDRYIAAWQSIVNYPNASARLG